MQYLGKNASRLVYLAGTMLLVLFGQLFPAQTIAVPAAFPAKIAGVPIALSAQVTKLLPRPGGMSQNGAEFGTAVALSADHLLVSGAWLANSGAVNVYERSGKHWHRQAILQPKDARYGDLFGASLAIDGHRIVIGAPHADIDGTNSGAAYIFEFDGMQWIERAQIFPELAQRDGEFGHSVAVHGDRVIVGAPERSSGSNQSGAAFVFRFNGEVWLQENELQVSDPEFVDDFGMAVSLVEDRAAIGAPLHDRDGVDSGAVYIFEHSDGSWSEHSVVSPADNATGDQFGGSLQLEGSLLAVGAPRADNGWGTRHGAVYLFEKTGDSWNQIERLGIDTAQDPMAFGATLDVSADHLVIGASWDATLTYGAGSAYVYEFDGVEWALDAQLLSPIGEREDRLGSAVAINGDQLVAGARSASASYGLETGIAVAFESSGGQWTASSIVEPEEGAADDDFGHAVGLTRTLAVIGAPLDSVNGADSGAAYIAESHGSSWGETVRILPPSGRQFAEFGFSVDAHADRFLIGAPGDSPGAARSGAAYLYDLALGEATLFVPSDVDLADPWGPWVRFGEAVELSGRWAFVAATRDEDLGWRAGAVYVFEYVNGLWYERQKLQPQSGVAGDLFGTAISADSGRLLVGAPGHDADGGESQGAAFLFEYNGQQWIEVEGLFPANALDYGTFGSSVSLLGNLALIGDPSDRPNAQGAAYVFRYDGSGWTQEAELVGVYTNGAEAFGASVGLNGDSAFVGSPGASFSGTASGMVYQFSFDGTAWFLKSSLVPSDNIFYDRVGRSLDVAGERVLIGVPGDDDRGDGSGSAVLFNVDILFRDEFES